LEGALINNKKEAEENVFYAFDRLKSILDSLLIENKLSIVQLSKNTGVPVTTIKRIKYSKDPNPTINSLLPIANFFSLTVNQLIGLEPFPKERSFGVYQENKALWTRVPIISWESILDWPENKNSYILDDHIITDVEISSTAFALVVSEDNWITFPKGINLIIDPQKEPKHKNYIIVFNKLLSSPFFYQLLTFDGTHYLKPPHVDYKTVPYDKDVYDFKGTLIQARLERMYI
jgi:transcriptional regulator with XRE-family HTH domain